MEKYIDLHIHTTASDGTLTPRQAVTLAGRLDLAAIAVTDHDTTAGLLEAMVAGAELGVEVIPGIELAADYRGRSVHILGYFIDPGAAWLQQALAWSVGRRDARNGQIVAAMKQDGFPISLEALQAEHPDAVLGRPHIAEWLMRHGYAASVEDAFRRWLNKGGPYYRPRERMTLRQAVQAIRGSGGLAGVAHPLQYGFPPAELEAFLLAAREAGCRALEAHYSKYGPDQQRDLCRTADRLGMALSGGSDFHGDRKPDIQMGSGIDGSLRVPYGVLERLRTLER